MAIDIRDPIFKEEIERFAEDTLALWKTQYYLFLKAQSQGAPEGLLVELSNISESFRQAYEKIRAITPYFPSENDRSY